MLAGVSFTRSELISLEVGVGTPNFELRTGELDPMSLKKVNGSSRRDRLLKVFVRRVVRAPPALRAADEPLLQQVRLNHVHERLDFFVERGGERVHPDGPAVVLPDDGEQEVAVEVVEALFVHTFERQRFARDAGGDGGNRFDLGVVANAAQEPVRDAGRAARAPGNFDGSGFVQRGGENLRRALDDFLQVLDGVEIQMIKKAEAIPQGAREAPGARRGAEKREPLERHVNRLREHAFVHDEIHAEVFHRRVEEFFDVGGQAVNLVNEQDVSFREVREDAHQVPGALERRAGGGGNLRSHFFGDDVGERGFAKPRRAVEESMFEGLLAAARRLKRDGELVHDILLPNVFAERRRAQRDIEALLFLGNQAGGNQAFSHRAGLRRACHGLASAGASALLSWRFSKTRRKNSSVDRMPLCRAKISSTIRRPSAREYWSCSSTASTSSFSSATDSFSTESGSTERARANLVILPRNSVTMRSAVFAPTNGSSSRNARSPRSLAKAISLIGRTRHLSARVNPTPGTVVKASKNSRSSGSRKPTSFGVRCPPPTAPSM